MKIEKYNEYMSEYIPGIKSIEHIQYSKELSKKTSNHIMKRSRQKTKLYYSSKGILIFSVHHRIDGSSYIINYCYNKAQKLIQTIECESGSHILKDNTNYYYNEDGLIDFVEGDNIEYNYTYRNESKSIQEYYIEEEEEYMHYIAYDNNKEIEIKVIRNENDTKEGEEVNLIDWVKNEYDSLGNLIKETSYNINEEEQSITEYSYFTNGLLKTQQYSSKTYNKNKRFEYLFNLMEHWSRKTEYHNEELAYYHERNIEYY